MINFFKTTTGSIIALESDHKLDNNEIEKLQWLFSGASLLNTGSLDGKFIGPRKEMITPWSTNAVEITQNMGLSGISRIEEYFPVKKKIRHSTKCCNAYTTESGKTFSKSTRSRTTSFIFPTLKHTTMKKGWRLVRKKSIT